MNIHKIIITVAGFFQCKDFNYACYITENLSNLLPNFCVKIIVKTFDDWKDWLENQCQKYQWCHNESPLIWRESGLCGAKSIYIGSHVNLREYINHYYGIDVVLSTVDYHNLKLDYSIVQNLILKNELQKFKTNIINITILGAGYSVCPDLVAQLSTLKVFNDNGIAINLYDEPGHYFKLKDIIKDATCIGGNLCSINNMENLCDALKCCNILIILDHISREEYESTYQWLTNICRNYKELAEQINLHASTDTKVILCSMGPICFCANVLAKFATNLDKNQIVAVSAHYGLEMIYDIAKSSGIPIKGIGCSPVWGFLGISQYVDVHHTLQKCSVYVPNKRALHLTESSLPLGTQYTELRWLLYSTLNKNPQEELANRKAICMYQVGRTDDFQKCRAICDLLKLWYEKDEAAIGDAIITLGISSDGTFNIPENVYFSQPVHLKILENNSRVWVPCAEFPFPCDNPGIIINLMETAEIILKNMDIID